MVVYWKKAGTRGVETWSHYFGPLASFEDELPGGLPLATESRNDFGE